MYVRASLNMYVSRLQLYEALNELLYAKKINKRRLSKWQMSVTFLIGVLLKQILFKHYDMIELSVCCMYIVCTIVLYRNHKHG